MTLHRQVRSINMKKVFVLHKKNLSKSSFSLEMLLIQHLYTTVQGIFQIKLHLTARYLLWMKQIESIVKTKINHLDVMKDFRKEGFIEACFNTRVNWFGGKDSFFRFGTVYFASVARDINYLFVPLHSIRSLIFPSDV